MSEKNLNETSKEEQKVSEQNQRKKKKFKIKYILLSVLLIIILIITWLFFSLFLIKPKNLGISYTYEDYINAIEKTGMQISFDGLTDEDLEEYKKNSSKKNIHDFNWEFSDYKEKSFTLTNEEATALLNNIAPGFWWFENLQVKVDSNGVMQGSSRADISRLKRDLYSDVANDIPIPLPNSVNIYSEGKIEINNNKLTGTPESFYVGAIPLPNNLMTQESISVMEDYFPRIYTIVPGLEINRLSTENGEFVFEGIIPQTITVTPK